MDDIEKVIASLDVRNRRTKVRNRVEWKAVVKEAKVHFEL